VKYSQARTLAAIKDSGGIKKNICAKLGIARPTFDEWLAKYPEIARAFVEEKEKLKDLAEERLIEQIQMGNLGAIIWYQKTQCRDRGYVERQEVSGPNGGPIQTQELAPDLTALSDDELELWERLLRKACPHAGGDSAGAGE
jgi:hypothetical protein